MPTELLILNVPIAKVTQPPNNVFFLQNHIIVLCDNEPFFDGSFFFFQLFQSVGYCIGLDTFLDHLDKVVDGTLCFVELVFQCRDDRVFFHLSDRLFDGNVGKFVYRLRGEKRESIFHNGSFDKVLLQRLFIAGMFSLALSAGVVEVGCTAFSCTALARHERATMTAKEFLR